MFLVKKERLALPRVDPTGGILLPSRPSPNLLPIHHIIQNRLSIGTDINEYSIDMREVNMRRRSSKFIFMSS